MRDYTPEMQAHIEQSTTTLTTCIRLERLRDSVVVAATVFNRPLTIDGDVYSSIGFKPADLASGADLDIPTTEVIGILDSSTLTEDDLRAGLWDFASYELFQVNWADLSMGRIQLASGTLGTVRVGRLQFTAELLGLMQAVQISNGYLTSPACIHELGASRGGHGLGNGCTVDLEGSPSFTRYGKIDSMDSDYYGLYDAARTEPDNTFSNGKITFLPSSPPHPLDGISREVRGYEVGHFVLLEGVPYDATGAHYKVTFGCDKSRRMCIDVFNNIEDRLAFDYSQGNDAASQVGRHNG